jgi:acyl carrier protein
LVRVPGRRARVAVESLAARLAAVPEAEREGFVAELVRSHVAAVLGHGSAAAIDPAAPFKDLGFDSLAAVELRNQLAQATGLRLPATLIFDYPSTGAVAGFLLGESEGSTGLAADAALDQAIEGLRRLLDGLPEPEREGADSRLRALLGDAGTDGGEAGDEAVERIRSADAEELLAIVEDEIGER